jgi:phage terminase large subunit
MALEAPFPEKLGFLFEPARFKVAYGGRGGAKSWGFARALLILGKKKTLRILCTREIQKSIKDSVHKLLSDQIKELGLENFYIVQLTSIVGRNGTEFIFAGMREQNAQSLKSYEGVDICWVEEAHTVSKHSWDVLTPTIRKDGSEIWISFNPELETDETYKRFVLKPPSSAKVVKIGWQDNPWFGGTLQQDRDDCLARDVDDYQHIWEGMCKQIVEGAIYKEQLIAADKSGRITRVPYDPIKPVDTFWDLGFGDNVSIWFAQSVGFEFHLIDFLSACQKDVPYYLKELHERPYVYGTHYLPHDAKAQQLAAGGRTVQQQISSGNRVVRIVPNISMEDGIAASRLIFGRCWFDAEKCADGIQALRHYRYEKDEQLGTFKKHPRHDWASHPADAFRYFGVAIKEPPEKGEPEQPIVNNYGEAGWMA